MRCDGHHLSATAQLVQQPTVLLVLKFQGLAVHVVRRAR